MNKPELTHEVALFLSTWDEYREAISACRLSSFEAYRGRQDYFGVIAYNEETFTNNRDLMLTVSKIGDRLTAMGQDVMTAATEYQGALYQWEREQEAEAERPRREWEAARDEYAKGLRSTVRSLAIKIGHAESKVYSLPQGEEREAAYTRLMSLRAEKQLADQLESAVSYLRYSNYQGQTFSEKTVLDYIETQRTNWEYVIEQLTGQPA